MTQSTYNIRQIRKLLTAAFSDAELRQICYDEPYFRPVYEQFSDGMGKDQVVQRVIEYAERKNLLGDLLAIVEEEAPAQYREFTGKLGPAAAGATAAASNANPALAQTRELLEMKQRHLHKLQMQKAAYGLSTPPHIEIEIEDLETDIANLRQLLKG